MKRLKLPIISFIAFSLFSFCDSVENAMLPTIPESKSANFEVIASGYEIPWAIEVIGHEDFLFTERLGKLYHYENGNVTRIKNLPVSRSVKVSGLVYGGLMDVSLHPEFQQNSLVYITYVGDDYLMKVARFKFIDNSISDLQNVFQSNAFSIGSRIAWQDNEHFFVTQGLGGTPYPEPGPQDLKNDGGKIHRLMLDGKIPQDNPVLVGSSPTSVWSYGHRDPQGLQYDSENGVLYSNEHGPLGGDEFNIITKGGNYGWPLHSYGLNYDVTPVSDMSEEEASSKFVMPFKYWDHSFRASPSCLFKPSDSNFSTWNGSFLFGALALQHLVRYNQDTDETEVVMSNIGRVRAVAQLPDGNLLISLDDGSPNRSDPGRILKLTPK